ncbi:MAG: YciE/YciF ferroxidase family protein [Chitinophaga sp.]|jgi:ferritin-like metal-binding protein YciE
MATKSAGSRNGTKKAGNGRSSAKPATTARKSTRSNGKSEVMPNSKFHQLFMDELKDIYWAEKHLVKALPKMQKAATATELADAFADHLAATKEHVSRVEEIFDLMGVKPTAKKCEAMEGLVMEAQELISEEEESSVLDAGLIIAAQKVEHYEIAAYGSLRTLANRMGHTEAADLLEQTLNEEKETDAMLTQIAESSVNEEAMAE